MKRETGKKKDLRFDFNEAAQRVTRDHPELRNKTLFINAAENNWRAVEAALHELDFDDDAVEEIRETFKIAKKHQTSFHQSVEAELDRVVLALAGLLVRGDLAATSVEALYALESALEWVNDHRDREQILERIKLLFKGIKRKADKEHQNAAGN